MIAPEIAPCFYFRDGRIDKLVVTAEQYVRCVLHDAQHVEVLDYDSATRYGVGWKTDIGWRYCPEKSDTEEGAWIVAMEYFSFLRRGGGDNDWFEDAAMLMGASKEHFSQYCDSENDDDLQYALLQLKRAWYLQAVGRGQINSYGIPAELL